MQYQNKCEIILYHGDIFFQLPGHIKLRLDTCTEYSPREPPTLRPRSNLSKSEVNLDILKWLQTLQFKMAQIELQSSQVNQFYSV